MSAPREPTGAPAEAGRSKSTKACTPKPHPLAFIADTPCANCGCEWFRPTVTFPENDDGDALEMVEGAACANLWCPMIRQLRAQVGQLKADRIELAKLAAETPQFDNPLHVFAAQTLRDKLLNPAPSSSGTPAQRALQ